MVYVNGAKYACQNCITGHRSTACNHTERLLLEVRRKGRPATQCQNCRNLRRLKSLHTRCDCDARVFQKILNEQHRVLPNGINGEATYLPVSSTLTRRHSVGKVSNMSCSKNKSEISLSALDMAVSSLSQPTENRDLDNPSQYHVSNSATVSSLAQPKISPEYSIFELEQVGFPFLDDATPEGGIPSISLNSDRFEMGEYVPPYNTAALSKNRPGSLPDDNRLGFLSGDNRLGPLTRPSEQLQMQPNHESLLGNFRPLMCEQDMVQLPGLEDDSTLMFLSDDSELESSEMSALLADYDTSSSILL